jgi:hypothetical protein
MLGIEPSYTSDCLEVKRYPVLVRRKIVNVHTYILGSVQPAQTRGPWFAFNRSTS